MNRMQFLCLFLLIKLCAAKVPRPNIIFILADDLGWNDVAFHGSSEIRTPNLDAMAADGVMLNKYYVTPLCTPSRAALMTGLYPAKVGLQNNVIDNAGPWGLPLQFKIFPEYMKELGYTTRMVGKWHLGFYRNEYTPTYRGFQSHYGFWGSNTDFFHHVGLSNSVGTAYVSTPPDQINKTLLFVGLDFRDDMKLVENQQERYLTDIYSEKAEEIIQRHNNSEPLFLYLAHHGVHRGNWLLPVRAPDNYVEGFDFIKNKTRQQFAGAVDALDQSIGRIFQALQDKGMLQNSIVVFSTDNGADHATFVSNGGSNWPLRGQKFTTWEGGVRGVGVVWSPMLASKGRVSDQMMHISDWLPTLYTAAGGDPNKLSSLDGIPMWNALSENLPSPRNLTLINADPIWHMGALRLGEYKIVVGSFPKQNLDQWFGPSARSTSAPKGFRTYSQLANVLREFYNNQSMNFKPEIVNINCGTKPTNPNSICHPDLAPCLFDINVDPCELNNIAEDHPELTDYMYGILSQYNETAYPPLNRALSYKANPLEHGMSWVPWANGGSVY